MRNYSIDVVTNVIDALLFSDVILNFSTPSEIIAPSLQPYWLLAFIRNYGWSRKLAVTVVSEDNKPRLIAPLQYATEDTLIFLCDETADYNDFFFDKSNPDSNLMLSFINYWFSRGIKKIKLDGLPHDSLSLDILQTIAKEKKIGLKVENCDVMPVVFTQVDKTIDAWEGIRFKWIKGYQRSMRRLNKKANILFSLIETEHELKAALPVIKEMHIRRWQSHNISSKFLDKRRDSFISEVCKEAVEVNSLFLPVMKIDGVIAAYHIGFRGGNTIFEWNTSFALEFSKWSPGALLMLYILSNAKAWGFSKYNLLRGQEQYKFIWTDKTEQTISVTVNQSEG